MRVAIYEIIPNAGGISVWSNQLQHGFRQLGHECDLVALTKSGKPSSSWDHKGHTKPGTWWRHTPFDVVGKLKNAASIFNAYDLVVLHDGRDKAADKVAFKRQGHLVPELPDYLVALMSSNTPFTLMLHGNNYTKNEAPFAEQLLSLPNYLGVGMTCSTTSRDDNDAWSKSDWVVSPIPYKLRHDPHEPPAHDLSSVGITGRYNWTKGHHALALTAGMGLFPTEYDVHLYGGCPTGRYTSPSHQTYVQLVGRLGLTGEHDGTNPYDAYTWRVKLPGGGTMHYHGTFYDGYETCQKIGTHVDLTSMSLSRGLLEYSELEAIDAGCASVAVNSMWVDGFHADTLPGVKTWPNAERICQDEAVGQYLEPLGNAVTAAVNRSPDDRRARVAHNRERVRELNDPAKVASIIINMYGKN